MANKTEKAIRATAEAELQYHWMCRALEQRRSKNLIKAANEAPLYLWTEEKYWKCIKYYENNELTLTDKIKCPRIYCDQEGCVILTEYTLYKNKKCIVDAIITAWVNPKEKAEDIFIWAQGTLTIDPDDNNGYLNLKAADVYTIEGKTLISSGTLNSNLSSEHQQAVKEGATNHIMHALCKQHYMIRPRMVVVKEVPSKPPKKSQDGMVPRVHQREIHIVLDPDEAHTIKRAHEQEHGGGTHASPVPHTRRSHVRVFKHPRYKNMKGKSIVIGDADIGVKPGEVLKPAKKIYHVVSVGGKTNIHQ